MVSEQVKFVQYEQYTLFLIVTYKNIYKYHYTLLFNT